MMGSCKSPPGDCNAAQLTVPAVQSWDSSIGVPCATTRPAAPPAAVPSRVTSGWWPGPVAESTWGQGASSGFPSGCGGKLGFSRLFWFAVALSGFILNAGSVLKRLRTWRGSAAEAFEASWLVFPSAPFRPGQHGQPKACPMDGRAAELGAGFAAALVPVVTKGSSVLPSHPQSWCWGLSTLSPGVGSHGNSSSGCGALQAWYHHVMVPLPPPPALLAPSVLSSFAMSSKDPDLAQARLW